MKHFLKNNIDIPKGNSKDDIKQRELIIRQFYQKWKEDNPSQRKFNLSLKDFINIRMISSWRLANMPPRDIFQRWPYYNLMLY